MSRVLSIGGTGLRRFLRERENIFFVFIFPILIILFVGIQFGSSGLVSTLGVVGADTPVGRAIVEAVEAEGFQVQEFDDAESALEAVELRSIEASIVVEDLDPVDSPDPVQVEFSSREGFGIELRQTVETAVQALSIDLRSQRYLIEVGGVDEATAAQLVEFSADEIASVDVSVSLDGESLFEGEIEQFDLGASSQLVLFTFLTSLSTSGHLILTRQLGVSARMMVSPTPVRSIVVGETLGRYLVALVQALFIVLATGLMFGVDWGDPLGSAAVIAVFALVSTSAGILLGSLLQNDQQAGGIGVMLGIGLGALGGAMVPYELFPDAVQVFSQWTPHYWILRAFRTLLFTDGALTDVLFEVGMLGMFAVVLLSIATFAYRRSITA
jgi:ABC-2 type transport system permease protein